MGSIYQKLTVTDVEKIKAELSQRIQLRHELLDEVKETRAQGDLSENFEYHEAKRAKNQNESRIRYLQNVLKNATMVSEESAEDEVGMNNTVTIYYPEDDEEETYKITTSIRANSMEDRLDMESPLGKAIMHHKVGDTVHVFVSKDVEYDVIIRAIDKTTDGDDDLRSY